MAVDEARMPTIDAVVCLQHPRPYLHTFMAFSNILDLPVPALLVCSVKSLRLDAEI